MHLQSKVIRCLLNNAVDASNCKHVRYCRTTGSLQDPSRQADCRLPSESSLSSSNPSSSTLSSCISSSSSESALSAARASPPELGKTARRRTLSSELFPVVPGLKPLILGATSAASSSSLLDPLLLASSDPESAKPVRAALEVHAGSLRALRSCAELGKLLARASMHPAMQVKAFAATKVLHLQ